MTPSRALRLRIPKIQGLNSQDSTLPHPSAHQNAPIQNPLAEGALVAEACNPSQFPSTLVLIRE